MNLLGLQQDVYRRTGATATPPAEVSTRITAYLNRWNRKILSSQGMESLRRVQLTQASVINQPTYGLALQSIRYLSESTTQRRLVRQTLGWYRDRFPKPLQFSSTPEWYVEMGIRRIQTLPTAPCQLFAVSSNAGDTGAVNVQVVRSNGYKATIQLAALTGIVPVAVGAFTDVIDIENFYLGAVQLGQVTLTQGSGGLVLGTIPIGDTYARALMYALVPTPSQVIPYTIDGIAEIVDLANPTDEPFPNPDFHDILIDGAVYDEWMMRGRVSDAKFLRADIELRIRRLRVSILEWAEMPDARRHRTFDESIKEPIL
jgi:hypothetical protein